jgi:apoptosis-inducing factor 2
MIAPNPQSIVILGGSYGGLSTAHYLLKHCLPLFPETERLQVVLVNPSTEVFCRPACPRALISDNLLPQDKLFVNIPKAFEQYPTTSFKFLLGTATDLDHEGRTITISLNGGAPAERIPYHCLVIATGASTYSPLLSVNTTVEHMKQNWIEFRKSLPSIKSIIIAGGGPAGVETAGELGEYLNGRTGWFSSAPPSPKVAITLVTAGEKILPVLRPKIAAKAEKELAKVGVTVVKNARVVEVEPQSAGTDGVSFASKTTVTLNDGRSLQADLYIPAMGTSPNTAFIDHGLLAADNRVETDAATLRVPAAGERVYAIGDASTFARPAVHNVLAAVPVLCFNLRRDLLVAAGLAESDAGPYRVFKEDTRETQLVPIGKKRGVGAAQGYRLPSFLVWLIKGRDYWLWTVGKLWGGKQWAKES